MALIVFSTTFAQQNSPRKERSRANKATKKVDDTNKKVNEANKTFNSATDSIAQTIEDTKKTAERLRKAIFGPKRDKNKVKKGKGFVLIQIDNIAYSNSDLNELQNYLTKISGVKKVSKSYANGSAIINIITKENADALWQNIPNGLNKIFIVKEMKEKHILLQFEKLDLNKQ